MDNQKKTSSQLSGSGSAHQNIPRRSAAQKPKAAPVKMKKSNKRRIGSRANENSSKRGIWKTLLLGCAVLAVILAVLLVIFGTEPKVRHQLPTVTPPEAVEETV